MRKLSLFLAVLALLLVTGVGRATVLARGVVDCNGSCGAAAASYAGVQTSFAEAAFAVQPTFVQAAFVQQQVVPAPFIVSQQFVAPAFATSAIDVRARFVGRGVRGRRGGRAVIRVR